MANLLERFLELEKAFCALKAELVALKAENAALKSTIAKLTEENTTLITENAQLKERLGLNSKNSSIPSSKELHKLKGNKPKSDRKQGGQPGHKGHLRNKAIPDTIIKIDLDSTECECGGQISLLKECYVHQKIEIPEIKPLVTEYHLERGRCRVCGKRKSSKLPEDVTPDLFGPRVKTVISALTGFYKNSKREVEAILKDLFNLEISLGTVSNNEARVSEKCKDNYETIELELSYSKLLHIDETGHYNKGKLGWCWLFSSPKIASLIKLTDSRGKKVLENSVFGANDSITVTDRYGAYTYFTQENRQICWSHLARDFERFVHSSNHQVKALGIHLKQIAYDTFTLRKLLIEEKIDLRRFWRRAKKLRKRMWYYLKGVANLDNAPHALRVAKNLLKSEEMMWKFLQDPKVIPMTNNHAEQQIRHYVVYRKNSYFTQSERGNRFLERVISLYLTYKQQNLNPVTHLGVFKELCQIKKIG